MKINTSSKIHIVRENIFYAIEPTVTDNTSKLNLYDWIMLISIITGIVPLAFKYSTPGLSILDKVVAGIFIFDYVLRFCTADFKFNDFRPISFAKYPFTIGAIIDLVSILPAFTILSNTSTLIRIFRFARLLRIFRIFRYSRTIRLVKNVLKSQKGALASVFTLAVAYILISATLMFNMEPDSFGDFFDAAYWSCLTLTTVGYGDIYPVTDLGRFIAMISSFFGIAMVAMPSGIITAGIMTELNKDKGNEEEDEFEKLKESLLNGTYHAEEYQEVHEKYKIKKNGWGYIFHKLFSRY
ncbi:ion transporter [Lachnospira pectinoschiza]|uniref:Voltage-gated potassium channel n=1 Tax=Lachnospira pectinoschiza TaxID=28052 RepID=A0A1G9U3C4_9FIRM|nr:ion transporter [Lachnospira pectinoschiza]SDM54055.1 voltage-gated potassium channel [Lachnospira pectinoschiza]